MTLAGPQSHLETTILQLIEVSAVSVRLSNALRAAKRLPIETVGEYLNAGDDAKLQFMRLHNLGRKSAGELDDLICAFAREEREHSLPVHVDVLRPVTPEPPNLRERLIAIFEDDTYPSIFLDNVVPKRVENCLLDEDMRPLSEAFAAWPSFCAGLLGRHNVGHQSIVDLSILAVDHIRGRLGQIGFTPDEIAAAAPVILTASTPASEAAKALELRLDGLEAWTPPTEVREPGTLIDVVSGSLLLLDERERDVLMRRYGYADRGIETLEAISLTYDVTRERIRQIESKALRKLSVRSVTRKIEIAFVVEKQAISARLHNGHGYVSDDAVYKAFQSLSAAQRIAIDLLYEDRVCLLKELATHWQTGWLFSPFKVSELDQVAEALRHRAKNLPMPNTLAAFAGDLPLDWVMPVLELATNFSTLEGYVTERWLGPRLKRTIRLHRELFRAGSPLEARELVAAYHKRFPSDRCSLRDAIIVMYAAPQLFVELQDGVWATVGSAPQEDFATCNDTAETMEVLSDLDEPSAQTIRAGLQEILRRGGPLRFVDLRNEAVNRLGQKHAHSIGPILLTSGTFIRPLPGIYALQDQLPDRSAIAFDPPDFLLNEDQVKWLAMARYAGEPFGSFALWQPEYEYALCRWGETSISPVLWQSLLAVASVHQWPVSDGEREHWRDLQNRRGAYSLMAPMRYHIRDLWPPLSRLLAALHVVQMRGAINWMVANRLLKRRIDAHTGPALLGILCLLDIVSPPAHWQMPHVKHGDPDSLITSLSKELQQTGSLRWESDIGVDILANLSLDADLPDGAWLDRRVITDLRSTAEDDLVNSVSVAADAADDDDAASFECLLEEVARQQRLADIMEDIRGTDDEDQITAHSPN